ncbi:MAG: hypothetical protein K2N21_06690 [Rikenellaceae bacterium]|nr:hypothetical protein [Rikenellaceae bacterium]
MLVPVFYLPLTEIVLQDSWPNMPVWIALQKLCSLTDAGNILLKNQKNGSRFAFRQKNIIFVAAYA